MNYIVDLILLAIFIFIVVRGMKKGFVTTLLDSLSVVISGIASYFLCSPISEWIYDNFISGIVKSKFTEVLKSAVPSGATLTEKIDKLVGSLPSFAVNLADYSGMDVKGFSAQIGSSAAQSAEQLVDSVADKVAYNILIFIVQGIVFFALFVLISFAVRFISRVLGRLLEKIPVVGSLNKGLGAVLGIIKAAAVLLLICTVLYFAVGSSANSDIISAVEASKIYMCITKYNPIINLF